jgi:hypothetical protein
METMKTYEKENYNLVYFYDINACITYLRNKSEFLAEGLIRSNLNENHINLERYYDPRISDKYSICIFELKNGYVYEISIEDTYWGNDIIFKNQIFRCDYFKKLEEQMEA